MYLLSQHFFILINICFNFLVMMEVLDLMTFGASKTTANAATVC